MTAVNITFTGPSGKQVTIGTTQIEEVLANSFSVKPFAIPSTESEQAASASKVFNLLEISRKFTVDGWIVNGLNPGVSEATLASELKTDLISMIKSRDASTMLYDKTTFNIFFEKMSIKEKSLDTLESEGVGRYDVKITCTEGDAL